MFEDWGKVLEGLAQNVGDIAQSVVKKTGELAEITSLHAKILARKKKADDEMRVLGRAFYEAHKDDMIEFGDKITAINDIYNEILLFEEEIKNLKEKLSDEEKIFADEMENEAADIVKEAKSGVKEAAESAAEEIREAGETAETTEQDAEETAETTEQDAEETAEAPVETEEVKTETENQ